MHKDKPVPHVHAEVIHAWADGQDVEWSFNGCDWVTSNVNFGETLSWSPKVKYRVKPTPPKIIELYANADLQSMPTIFGLVNAEDIVGNFSNKFISTDNLKLSFCPVAGILIAAELVKHEKADDNG